MSKLAKYLVGNRPYQEEEGSTFTHDGVEYDLNALLRKTAKFSVGFMAVDKLTWIFKFSQPDPIRKRRADPSKPLLVIEWQDQWVVLDGLHRLAKAVDTHLKQVPVIIVTQDMLEPVTVKTKKKG